MEKWRELENIKIDGYKGTWYEIDRMGVPGTGLFLLLEHETYGDESPWLLCEYHNNGIITDIAETYDDIETAIHDILGI